MKHNGSFLKLTFVTPIASVIHAEVLSIILPGKNGYFEVLDGHTPFLTQIVPGIASIKDKDGIKELCVSEGYACIRDNVVDVIVSAAEWPHEIDEIGAQQLKEEALKNLSNLNQFNPEYQRWENRLRKAESRLELLSRYKAKK